MSKRKKLNPHRQPRAESDLRRARSFGVTFGIHISLWAAKEYANLSDEQIEEMARGVKETAEHISAGRINFRDITSALENDYDLKVETRYI